MKRYLIALGVGAMVFAGALGSAAALGINDSGVAQYGDDFDVTCDDDGVEVLGYFLDTDAGAPSQSNGVVVDDVSSDCEGKTIVAGVTDANGDALARGAATIPSGGGSVNISYNIDGGPQVPVEDIGGVRLTIG
ncbi:MAG: hypothetical protein U5K30_01770 [Acidimicrobiales bacterium]|nr:hypothetical protein [Acidimicrobiales bacterium]